MTTFLYGGWFAERPASTGSSFELGRVICLATTMLLSTGFSANGNANVGTGTADLGFYKSVQTKNIRLENQNLSPVNVHWDRLPIDDLEQIRKVISPAVSDLAKALGVSRQTVYNWAKGEQPTEDHCMKLRDIASAADLFETSGITVTGAMLKRNIANGKTLLGVAQAGDCVRDAAMQFIETLRNEYDQRARFNARFSGRKPVVPSVEFTLSDMNDMI